MVNFKPKFLRLNTVVIFSFIGLIPVLSQEKQPNFLFIVSEDNGTEMGCYGTPIQTPNFDKLADQGVLFERAYVPQAGCSPSRAAFLTGLYPHQNGQIGLATWKYHMFNPSTPNIPTTLKLAGYTTGIIGKLHINPASAFYFDFKAIPSANFQRKEMSQYAEEAEEFMHNADKPFYLQVNHPDAHAPFIREVDGLPNSPLDAEDVDALPYMGANHPRLKEMTANYYNCMMRLDTYVGDLIAALKRTGKYENTLIVYIGDHGADILRGKRTSYEGGVRIPIIVSWPGKKLKPIRSKELVSTIDLFPTFLEAAGLQVPEYLPGKSLLPLLHQEEVNWREFLFTEFHVHSNHNPFIQRTVCNERYKLIHNLTHGRENPGYAFTFNRLIKYGDTEILKDADRQFKEAYELMKNPPEYELYDLEEDPYEFKNLSDNESYVDILEQLKSALLSWQKETSDPLIDKEKAIRLFNLIQGVGTDQNPRVVVPYAAFMDPKMKFKQ